MCLIQKLRLFTGDRESDAARMLSSVRGVQARSPGDCRVPDHGMRRRRGAARPVRGAGRPVGALRDSAVVRLRVRSPRGHQVSDGAQGGHQRRLRLRVDARAQRLLHDPHRNCSIPGRKRRRHPQSQLQRRHLPH